MNARFLGIVLLLQGSVDALFERYQAHKVYDAGTVAVAQKILYGRIADNPTDWRALYDAGVMALNEKKFDEAISHLEKVVELNPQETRAQELLTIAQRERERQRQQEQQDQQKSGEQSKGEQSSDQQKKSSDDQSNQNQQEGQKKDEPNSDGAKQNKKSAGQNDGQAKSQNSESEQPKNGQPQKGLDGVADRSDSQRSDEQQATSGKKDEAAQKGNQQNAQAHAGQQSVKKDVSQSGISKNLESNGSDRIGDDGEMSPGERYLMRLVESNDKTVQKQILQRAMMRQAPGQGVEHDW